MFVGVNKLVYQSHHSLGELIMLTVAVLASPVVTSPIRNSGMVKLTVNVSIVSFSQSLYRGIITVVSSSPICIIVVIEAAS